MRCLGLRVAARPRCSTSYRASSRPSEGRVLFDGEGCHAAADRARNIAQVFQFPVIYDTMTVGENLAFPLKNRGMDRRAIEARVAEIADLLGLTQGFVAPGAASPPKPSRRVSLGRGLVRSDVAAILFDEPLTVIDPEFKWQLRSKLKACIGLSTSDDDLCHARSDRSADVCGRSRGHEGRQRGAERRRRRTVRTAGAHFRRLFHRLARHESWSRRRSRAMLRTWPATPIELGARYPKLAGRLEDRFSAFRPDYAFLVPDGGIPVQIRRLEDLGRRRLARVALGPHEIFATVPHGVRSTANKLTWRSGRIGCSSMHDDELVPGDRR
jgi:glycerol transport system ATP-binding protein